MNNKNNKRHIAYDALVLLGLLALLTYMTRLWPILLLIILGIFIAALWLLFLVSREVEQTKTPLALPPAAKPATEQDMQSMAYSIIQHRITQILQGRFPEVRWIWESPRAKEDIMAGRTVYVLLNRAGGYRRGRVVILNLQVLDVVFEEQQEHAESPVTPPPPQPAPPAPDSGTEEDDPPENFGLIAFQWVDTHVMELNDRCNEAAAEGLSEYLIPAEELPVSESWDEICKELIRNELRGAQCCDEGILIEFEQ